MASVTRSGPRRSTYTGFQGVLKAVGTGERGRRALGFEEARAAMGALLDGEVTPAQAGAFLLAVRLKGETPEELAGYAQALRDRAVPLEARTQRPVVACAGAFDGCVDAPSLSVATGVVAAACGAAIVLGCGTTLGPKRGVTSADVLGALGGCAQPGPAESEAMLERAGIAVVHAGESVTGWSRLAALRDEVGLRGPVHSAEKLVDWFGARRFVVGYAHAAYADRLRGALDCLGAQEAIAVKGLEGSDVLRPGRPTAFGAEGRLDLPEQLGDRVPDARGAAASAELTQAIVGGAADRVHTSTVALSAGLRLRVAGLTPTVLRGMSAARAAMADGRARGTLEALVG